MSDTEKAVQLVSHGTVRQIVLNAPARRNALNRPMLDELAATVAAVAEDPAAKAVVVSGAGKAFCAGADVRTLFGDPNRDPQVIRQELRAVYDGFLGLRDLAIPTIAAVHGVAVGAGVNIALACDVIVVEPSARFVVSFAEIGLHPGGGCSWFLTRQLGARRAMDIILGGRTIDADRAVELGMALELADDAEAAGLALAEQYAAREIELLRDMKRAVRLAEEHGLEDVLEFESRAQASSVNRVPFQTYLSTFAR